MIYTPPPASTLAPSGRPAGLRTSFPETTGGGGGLRTSFAETAGGKSRGGKSDAVSFASRMTKRTKVISVMSLLVISVLLLSVLLFRLRIYFLGLDHQMRSQISI